MANISFDFFYMGGFPSNNPGKELSTTYGLAARRLVPNQGSIVGMVFQSKTPILAGQLLAKPTIDGIEVGSSLLNLVLDSSHQMNHASIPSNTPEFEFNQGQELGIKVSSSLDWNNENGNIFCTLIVNLANLPV